MSQFIKTITRVQNLRFKEAWGQLSDNEKNYAYYLSRSSWAGAKMVLHQICYEGPILFCMLQLYFQDGQFDDLREKAIEGGVSGEEYEQFLAYSAGFYSNMSNYHSFGHNKFIPELKQESFVKILRSNPLYEQKDKNQYSRLIDELYGLVEKELYAMESPYNQIGFPEVGGITGYFSRNMKEADLNLCKEFQKSIDLNLLNTRTFKISEKEYLIRVGSIVRKTEEKEYKDVKFRIEYGEFSGYLKELVRYLKKAKEYVSNENQREMIKYYIEHYESGDVELHRKSQIEWIKDKSPVVESNQGWIEVYIDPENVRGYFEGWVAIVDKVKSEKFQELVRKSEQIIEMLPWEKRMEKDKFLAPDFTTLEVISFATNGCPLGINIPNYDDIRENIGFKNVYLNNSMPTIQMKNIQFATTEQAELLASMTARAYVVHVACHELLGHGVGKTIFRDEDGKDSEFVDPISKESFRSCYEKGENWNEKFGKISASYEECRADTCGFYLAKFKEVYDIFGIKDNEKEDMLWCSVMGQFRKGILGLSLYNAESKKWGQAHTQGAFVFGQFIYQNQKSKIVWFELDEENQNFYIHLDKENLMKEGQELIELLLMVLQTYKSSGAVERANAFYAKYSEVDEFFMKIRQIVIDKKLPRRLELNNNLFYYNEKNIEVKEYPECFEGIIESYVERYGGSVEMVEEVMEEWNRTQKYLRV